MDAARLNKSVLLTLYVMLECADDHPGGG